MADSSESKRNVKDQPPKDASPPSGKSGQSEDHQNELIDDEDAIERLLMDNAFDNFGDDEERDEFAEIDELISEQFEAPGNSGDQTADDDVDSLIAEMASEESFGTDPGDLDEFIEIDEFGDDEFVEAKEEPTDDDESGTMVEDVAEHGDIDEFGEAEDVSPEIDESFLLADFDISAEESGDEIVMNEVGEEASAPPMATDSQAAAQTQQAADSEATASALLAVSEQLRALQDKHRVLKEELQAMEARHADSALGDELDSLNSEQKKMHRRLSSLEQRKPVLAYVALGVAVFAMLVGGGFGMVGFFADSRVDELSDTLISLEEKVDAWMAKSKGEDASVAVSARLDKVDIELANLAAKTSAVTDKLETSSGKGDIKKLGEQVEQFNERNLQTAAVLEALQQKVENLEKQRVVTDRKKNVKVPVVKVDWKVNLVSFKQEWYARRKAAEFAQQGVAAEVTNVVIKGEPWYRLRVKGFDSKYEAAAYAAKVKKTLNLSSVWVTKD